MEVDLKNSSIAHWFADTEKHRCGYCKNVFGSISNGMWAEALTVEDYQDLIDRGWRRSGKYCYKPIMNETCCPQYTIKCDARYFVLSKSQKRVIKKFNKYLEDGILNKKDIPPEAQSIDGYNSANVFVKECPNINFTKINKSEDIDFDMQGEENVLGTGEPHLKISDHENVQEKINDNLETKVDVQKNTNLKTSFKEGCGPDSSKPPCKKAKLLRLERKKEKLMKRGIAYEKTEPLQHPKSFEQFLEQIPQNSKHKLRLELIPTSEPSVVWEEVKDIEYQLYRKYQMTVHNDPPTKLSIKGFNRFLVNSPLKITLERMSSKHELFLVSAKLYQKYQIIVHNEDIDECDEGQFHSFLVQTPLQPAKFPHGVDGPGYGSFHQQYWLDDELIAVGVIDILPRCVSSVYFFYDPDYRNLTLGTYGSLREVQFTRSLQQKLPELYNYYMGFYIHSCPKMRYKGKLMPSLLLCPETYRWIPVEMCIDKLDANKYSRLEFDIDALDESVPTSREIDEMKVVYNYRLMYFRDYKKHRKEQMLFAQIGELVGRKCAKRIVFCIN